MSTRCILSSEVLFSSIHSSYTRLVELGEQAKAQTAAKVVKIMD